MDFASRLEEAIESLVRGGIIINPVEIFIQLIATFILIVVVKKFLWDKVTTFIEARQALVDDDITAAKADREKAQSLREKAEAELNDIREEAKRILDAAKAQAKTVQDKSITATQDDIARMKKDAQDALAKDLEQAKKTIRQEIVAVAIELSKKVIAQEIDEKKYHQLIDEAIKDATRS
jgi:F-type H+-transporting ATPase subunit b